MNENIVRERRRVDRDTMQEQERRRYERMELSEDAYVQDKNGRRLGLVSHVSGGGLRIFLENDEQLEAFAPEQEMDLIVVEESGTRTEVHVRVVYVNAYDVGLEFVS